MLMSEGDRLIRDLAAADSHDNADMIVKKKKKSNLHTNEQAKSL